MEEHKDLLEVGFNFPVPEGHQEIARVGGYLFTIFEDGLYVCGSRQFNLSENPIFTTHISPITKKRLFHKQDDQDEQSLSKSFYIEDDHVYFGVEYGGSAYIFKKLEDAVSFLTTLVKFKADGLQSTINAEKLQDTVEEN